MRYLTNASRQVLQAVRRMRRDGLGAWATMDAGPNVKVLCAGEDAEHVAAALRTLSGRPAVVARSGPGATLHPGTG